MAYNNYFPAGYQPMQMYQPQQMAQQMVGAQMSQPQPQQTNNKIYVQGDTGAKSYLVAPGSVVTLWDSESPVFYEKSADYSGVPHIRKAVYRYEDETSPHGKPVSPESEFATKDDVSLLKEEIEALKAKLEPVKGSAKK